MKANGIWDPNYLLFLVFSRLHYIIEDAGSSERFKRLGKSNEEEYLTGGLLVIIKQ